MLLSKEKQKKDTKMKGSIGCFIDPTEKSKQTTFCDFEEITKI